MARTYSEAMTVRVVFADDNYLVREGVAGLLTETPDVELLESVETRRRCTPPWPHTCRTRS